MNQIKSSASDKQRKVSTSRDSPQTNVKKPTSEIREGVVLVDHSSHRAKPVMRNYNPPRESKVKVVSSWESKKLFASQSTRRSVFGTTIKKKLVMVSNAERKRKNVIGSGDNKCVGVAVADHSSHRPKEAESRAGFKDNVGSDPVMRNFNPARGSKIKLVSSEESEKLLASQRYRRHVSVQVQRKLLVVNAVMKKKKKKKRSDVDASRLRENARKATQHRDDIRSNQRELVRVPQGRVNAVVQEPADQDQDRHVVAVHRPNGQKREIRNAGYDRAAREKVLEVLRLFKQGYKRLKREKEERRGTDLFQGRNRIDIKTLKFIENMGKRVNVEMRIGSVPGIRVGDRFQYKTQLRAVGLHSKTMCGIDYMKVGDMKLATSITASEGYGYNDEFVSGVLFYTGEGGNVISKEKKAEHQKLTKGNLALVNSMRYQRVVRVIRGEERCGRKGKRYYTYVGLYLVDDCWSEIQDRKVLYKFKLCRIPGQPPLTCC